MTARPGWQSVHDIVFDGEANVVTCGAGTDGAFVWSVDLRGRPRWTRPSPFERGGEPAHLVADRGRVGVWAPRHHEMRWLAPSDGRVTEQVGAPEPSKARQPSFDLCECRALTCDPTDGSLVGAFGARLVRFSAEGRPMPLWPPQPLLVRVLTLGLADQERRSSLYEPARDQGGFETGGRTSRALRSLFWSVPALVRPGVTGVAWWGSGPAGGLVFASIDDGVLVVHRVRRDGTLVYRVGIPARGWDLEEHPVLVFDGSALVLVHDEKTTALWRVAVDGSEVREIWRETGRRETRLGRLAAAADGTIAIAGLESLRVLSSSGEVLARMGPRSDPSTPRSDPLSAQLLPPRHAAAFGVVGGVFALAGARALILETVVRPELEAAVGSGEALVNVRAKGGRSVIRADQVEDGIAAIGLGLGFEALMAVACLLALPWMRRTPRTALLAVAGTTMGLSLAMAGVGAFVEIGPLRLYAHWPYMLGLVGLAIFALVVVASVAERPAGATLAALRARTNE